MAPDRRLRNRPGLTRLLILILLGVLTAANGGRLIDNPSAVDYIVRVLPTDIVK
jgi:hypothetical protein